MPSQVKFSAVRLLRSVDGAAAEPGESGSQDEPRPHRYGDVYEIERGDGYRRLVFGGGPGEVDRALALVADEPAPFVILYVSLASRIGAPPGRYESLPLDLGQLRAFFDRFRAFVEQDARHEVWIIATATHATVVIDRHHLGYAYGDLDRFRGVLRDHGFRRGRCEIPSPHAHHVHAAFDDDEAALFSAFDWTAYPLGPDDGE